jgi:chemotaxis protein CheX
MPASPLEVPQEVTDAFSSAAITALQELVQLDAIAEPLTAPAAMEAKEFVCATMRLIRNVPGSMNLLLTAETAAHLAGRYLPQGTLLTKEIINDVAGEFANVIAGQAKTILKGTPHHFMISTPVIVRVAELTDLSGTATANLVVSLTSEVGRVQVMINKISSAEG